MIIAIYQKKVDGTMRAEKSRETRKKLIDKGIEIIRRKESGIFRSAGSRRNVECRRKAPIIILKTQTIL